MFLWLGKTNLADTTTGDTVTESFKGRKSMIERHLDQKNKLWRACNLTPFSPCLTGPVDYLFASHHKGPVFKTPRGTYVKPDSPVSVVSLHWWSRSDRSFLWPLGSKPLGGLMWNWDSPVSIVSLQNPLFPALSCLSVTKTMGSDLSSKRKNRGLSL